MTRYPHILLEGCASGGGRFDPGMLYYSPQIWTSDCSDAIERLDIQYGTSLCYPPSSMGAHVSAVPNHQTGRSTSFVTRGNVAMQGTFGYRLIMMGVKLLLLPVVVSISYELNRLIGRHDNWLTAILMAPGLWLQRITTNEPDDSMIEVGIAALEAVLPEKEGADRW